MKINISDDTTIDLDKLIESRALFQANSGGGKSWAGRRFIEQAFGKKQIIIIDPEGEFGNMRREFDFVYIGQGGDAPAEPRSAALLARRLLETKANAIIDIYELGSKRSDFVKAFFDACVNMPKELWTDCFFLLDEAHKFAPEKGQGESIALQSVIDMASLGRKRGYCLIPMTQRPAKLSKDVVAECNNKLIGRASLDIDRERSAKELGFRTKEDILSLRDLKPGEFYVFGPAISNEVKKITVGDIKVKPPKRGTGRSIKIAPASAKVKKWLAELADLPKEAEKEATTAAELKQALIVAKRKITELEKQYVLHPVVQKEVNKAALQEEYNRGKRDMETVRTNLLLTELEEWKEYANKLATSGVQFRDGFLKIIKDERPKESKREAAAPKWEMPKRAEKPPVFEIKSVQTLTPPSEAGVEDFIRGAVQGALGKGEMVILNAIAQDPEGMTNEHIAVITGYKQTSRRVYLQKLLAAGLIEKNGDVYSATEDGMTVLGPNFKPLPTGRDLLDYWLETLPEGEGKILKAILNFPTSPTRQEIQEVTGYKATSVRVYVQKLLARKIIYAKGPALEINDNLLR